MTDVLNGFRRIMRALRMAAGETQSRFEISAAQLYVLAELSSAQKALSINELAALTMTDRSSVANVVDRLVENGYASRQQSAVDRRRAEVRISSAGENLARSAPPSPAIRLLAGLRRLSAGEIGALADSIKRLQEEMGIADEPARFLFDDEPTRPASARRR